MGGQFIAAAWTDVIIFSILVLVLVFKPPACSGAWRRTNRERRFRMTQCSRRPCRRPFERIPEARRRRIGLVLLVAAAVLFPLLHDNDADIDSMANAAAYATLALGLNIVVGFAGLLDLGYAAFFAIGAYTYGILSSFQFSRNGARSGSRSGSSAWWRRCRPRPATAAWCISPCRSGWRCRWRRRGRVLRRACSAPRPCGCAATIWPSSRWASARSCRSWCATGPT